MVLKNASWPFEASQGICYLSCSIVVNDPSQASLLFDIWYAQSLSVRKNLAKNVAATVIHTCKAVLQGINKHIDVNLWTPCPRFSENWWAIRFLRKQHIL